jgi:hypothetical protein
VAKKKKEKMPNLDRTGKLYVDPKQAPAALPDYEPDPELKQQLGVFEYFANLNIASPIFEQIQSAMDSGEGDQWTNLMKDPNLVILFLQLKYIQDFEPESVYKQALINLKKLDIVLFRFNPWYRSRRGWDMWWMATHQNPDSYYPLGWEMHYDPRIWYRVGEKPRPPGYEPLPNFSNFYPVKAEATTEVPNTESGTS